MLISTSLARGIPRVWLYLSWGGFELPSFIPPSATTDKQLATTKLSHDHPHQTPTHLRLTDLARSIMADAAPNPLLSSQTDSQLQAILHPLVLLTISDYITRHTLRQQNGPIIGALLGQQNGREITIEHAFECHTTESNEVPGGWKIDHAKFTDRLEQSQ